MNFKSKFEVHQVHKVFNINNPLATSSYLFEVALSIVRQKNVIHTISF
jgi:hypothetical protein